MSKNEKPKLKVLRVTQFDAEQIDNSIFNILKSLLVDSFKGDRLSWILNYEPELSTCLQLVLWYLSVQKLGKSIGQSMLGTELNNQNGSIADRQKKGFLIFVFLKWFRSRESFFVKLFEMMNTNHGKSVNLFKIFKRLEVLSDIFVYVNMLQFVRTGDHVSITERCLQLRHVYTGKPYPRYIDYSYIRKEMMWESITQTVLCILPLINFRKIVIVFTRLLKSHKKGEIEESKTKIECKICMEVATNPYQNGCSHLFCYYCLMVNTDDGSFQCQVCGNLSSYLFPASSFQTVNSKDS